MQNSNVFRKISLDRLSSPEQLDQVMQVTRPRGWVALAALGLLLVTAVVWGFTGSLAENVGGRGMLVKSGGVLEVVSNAAGRVTDVALNPGDSVTAGQVVAWVAQPELFDNLQAARRKLEALRIDQRQNDAYTDADAALQKRNLEHQRDNLVQSMNATKRSLDALAERVTSQEQLVRQGLITRATLLSTQQQYDQLRDQTRNDAAQIAAIAIKILAVENDRQQAVRSGERQVEEARAEMEQLEREVKSSSEVVSPYTGRILEVMAEQGKILSRGDPVVSLDLTGRAVKDLVAIIYVPSMQGKMVHPGMQIRVAPSTVRQEEYGMMLGKVTFVSNFPATPQGMWRVLKNQGLVQELSGGDAPYEVHAELEVDPATVSRYRWSSSEGPPTTIQSGTRAMAQVTVDVERPIARVIPLFRRWTGI